MFSKEKKRFYFQICFITGKGEQVGVVAKNDEPFVNIKIIRDAAQTLSLPPDSVPSNVFCYGRMTEKQWKEG